MAVEVIVCGVIFQKNLLKKLIHKNKCSLRYVTTACLQSRIGCDNNPNNPAYNQVEACGVLMVGEADYLGGDI